MRKQIFPKKSLAMPKELKGSFGLVRYCMLRGKPSWFSSLGQRVQFDVLKFCRTFGVELFWSLQVSKKNYKQAGTCPSRRHIQGSKNSKRTSKCQFTVLENRKTKKMDRVARRGPLARAPGALKGGHTSEIVNIFVAVEGGTLWRKKFSKSHNAEKLKGETL